MPSPRPLTTLLLVALALGLPRGAAQAPGYPHGGGACATAADCSLGGDCAGGACQCDAWWTGADCRYLNLQRPRLGDQAGTCGAGFASYYSWGGRSLHGADGRYHLFASFMCRHATLSEWTTASASAHFVSPAPDGAFEWFEGDCDAGTGVCAPIVPPWSHNTVAVANGVGSRPAFLVAHIGDGVVPPSAWAPCFNKSDVRSAGPQPAAAGEVLRDGRRLQGRPQRGTAAGAGVGPEERPAPPRADPGDTTYFAVSDALDGPWTRALNNSGVVINATGSWAAEGFVGNPAPLVFANGSARLYFTARNCPPGHGALNGNCIAVAHAESWEGPYDMRAARRPVTYPESEDPFVFVDHRGAFHLLTNVNTGHDRCGQGVPCGGHAWSADGLVFSDLVVGAFGPIVTMPNGSVWRNAYVERPLVTFRDDGVTPLAFHVGMGRASYVDSCNWVQLFCSDGADASCGPTRDAPPARVRITNGGRCLVIFNASQFPCSGSGPAAGCPVVMGPCDDPSAVWTVTPGGGGGGGGPVMSAAVGGGAVGLDVDCNSAAPHTVVKALASGFAAVDFAGGRAAVLGGSACFNTGQGPPRPPCGPPGELYLDAQVQLVDCADPTAQGWAVEPAAEPHGAQGGTARRAARRDASALHS